jgi:hypothetical protein
MTVMCELAGETADLAQGLLTNTIAQEKHEITCLCDMYRLAQRVCFANPFPNVE